MVIKIGDPVIPGIKIKILAYAGIKEAQKGLEEFLNSGIRYFKIHQSESCEYDPEYGNSWSVTYTIEYEDKF